MNSASLAVFRIAFGVAMMVNVALYVPVLVYQYYLDTDVQFPYGPLLFVPTLPGFGIYVVYVGIFVTGALIALGKWYRPAVTTLFVLATYVFLLDSTFYQNHEYLVSMLAFLMIFLPLDQRWSLDARRHPERASGTAPAWTLWLLRFQIGIPYFFGGIAKINADWLQGEPLRRWLAARTDTEPINTILTTDAVVWFMAYGALVLDLSIVFLLLYRPTRTAAFVVVTLFHLLNVWLFGLFIFPWLMIAATTLFFEPDWPERVGRRIPHRWRPRRWPFAAATSTPIGPPPDRASRTMPALLATFLLVWAALQVTLPFRHYAIDGNPSWTEQGHRFAWHMKLRDKQGTAMMIVETADRTMLVAPRDHLGDKQAARLAGHPDRLAHFARYLSGLHDGAEVRAETSVSLNGRAPQPIVDPTVDLSRVPRFELGRSPWILDLAEPLP
ncbi:HTTM domain-containing protein [soil metagenome]